MFAFNLFISIMSVISVFFSFFFFIYFKNVRTITDGQKTFFFFFLRLYMIDFSQAILRKAQKGRDTQFFFIQTQLKAKHSGCTTLTLRDLQKMHKLNPATLNQPTLKASNSNVACHDFQNIPSWEDISGVLLDTNQGMRCQCRVFVTNS